MMRMFFAKDKQYPWPTIGAGSQYSTSPHHAAREEMGLDPDSFNAQVRRWNSVATVINRASAQSAAERNTSASAMVMPNGRTGV